ncbi:MAG TPA: hypothetical protein VLB04_07945 [Methanotrichaceae archaeon]|nr:hypothetical protein [Methanotrichaceae archaeon]
MDKTMERASAELTTIEIIHDVKFKNKDEIARMIAEGIGDERRALLVCTAINLWVVGNEIKGETVIPENLVADVLKAIRK